MDLLGRIVADGQPYLSTDTTKSSEVDALCMNRKGMTYLRDWHTNLYAGLFVRPVGSGIRLIMAAGIVGLVLAAVLLTQHFLPSPISSVATTGLNAYCTAIVIASSHARLTPATA